LIERNNHDQQKENTDHSFGFYNSNITMILNRDKLFLLFFILFIHIIVLNADTAVIVPINSIIKDTIPYANSNGVCLYSFLAIGLIDMRTGGGIQQSCSITGSGPTQPSCTMSINLFNTTHFYIMGDMTLSINEVSNLQLVLTKTIDSSTVTRSLVNPDGTPFIFKCESGPTNPEVSAQLLEPTKFLNGVYESKTFVAYIKLNNLFVKPFSSIFYCEGVDYSCTFNYIDTNTIVLYISFVYNFLFVDNGYVRIKYYDNPISELLITNPLYQKTGTLTINEYKEFLSKPKWGYYLDTSLNGVFPAINLVFQPLYGNSTNEMKYYVKNVNMTPRMITSDAVTAFLKQIPDIVAPNIVQKTPSVEIGFIEIGFDTSSRYLTALKDYGVSFSFYPYGLVSYDGTFRNHKLSISLDQYMGTFIYQIGVPEFIQINSGPLNPSMIDNVPPFLDSLDMVLLNDTHSVLRIGASDNLSGVAVIKLGYLELDITKKNLVSGTMLQGIYEIIVPTKKSIVLALMIFDNSGLLTYYSIEKLNFQYGFVELIQSKSYLLCDLTNVYFSTQEVDVTSTDANVVLYVNITQTVQQREEFTSIIATIIYNSLSNKQKVIGVYNKDSQMYEFPFKIPAKSTPRSLDYRLSINYQSEIESSLLFGKFGVSSTLNIKNTGDIDETYPIVTKCNLNRDNINPIGWDLEFYDNTGIGKIIVGVSSEYDMQGKNFTLDGKNQTTFQYTLKYPVDQTNCRPMNYWISYIYTEDTLGHKGESVRYSNSDFHPFFGFDDVSYDVIPLASTFCTRLIQDFVAPTIETLSFKSTTNSTIQNEQVSVQFQVVDNTEISLNHMPVCFFTSRDNELVSAVATIVISTTPSVIDYICDFVFPFSFGPDAFLSIYGLSDIYYNYKGYSTKDLQSIPSSSPFYTIPSTSSLVIIESTSSMEQPTDILYIYGRGFKAGSTMVHITTDEELLYVGPNIITGSVIVLYNIKQSLQYKIQVTETISKESSLVVTLKGYTLDPPSSSSQETTPPTTTPPPTCKMDCGASLGYGVCKGTSCICIAPHSGIDCSSIISNTTVIESNPDKPSVNLTLDGSSSDANPPRFSSFIELIAIRELDNGGNDIVSNHIFNNDKWINIKSTSNEEGVNSLQFKYVIDNSLNTTIYSTVQVFSQSKLITFGKQQLQMNPSTVKFTFNITSYPFAKSTNTLQLIMSASLLSDQQVGCSYKEFIQDESDSQYLKIQINQISLFGRFIGYAIIDGRDESITNTIVNNIDDQIVQQSSSKSQQSYIGLNIRYFKQTALLDPDFSVLIESKSASDQVNSICTSQSSKSSKLTSAQIAGIVVGGVVFLFIVGALIIYFLSKKTSSPIVLKLRRIAKN